METEPAAAQPPDADTSHRLAVSVIVPVYQEARTIAGLVEEIHKVMRQLVA